MHQDVYVLYMSFEENDVTTSIHTHISLLWYLVFVMINHADVLVACTVSVEYSQPDDLD